MFIIRDYQKEDILKQIQELEQSFKKKSFEKKYKDFFIQACSFLEIPDHIIKNVYKIGDPYLKDSIIWSYMCHFGLNAIFRKYKCFEINAKITKRKHNHKSLLVEPLESFGMNNLLPSKEIYTSSSAYIFINNNPYLITLIKKSFFNQDEDNFYSEQKWANKETAIFIALINLSIEYGWCTFFISDMSFYIPMGLYGVDLNILTKKNIERIERIIELYKFINNKTMEDNIKESQRIFSYKRNIDIRKINTINKKIDRKNSVLIRCLYYFAKACVFTSHRMMMEEATALQMFCLDGLTKLFMQKYNIKKVKDLGNFLNDKFKCPYGEYLKELHDERTIYVHPANIHGDYWCPPWDADTCYETLDVVRNLLILYLTNKFEPSNI